MRFIGLTFFLLVLISSPVKGLVVWAEFDEYTGGASGNITGQLNGQSLSMALTRNSFNGTTDVIHDNTYQGFTNIGITPQTADLDVVTLLKDAAQGSGNMTIDITFGSPISNPVFHILSLDSTRWDFSSTVDINMNVISQNGTITLAGNELFNTNDGASGEHVSVQLIGTYSSLSATVTDEYGFVDSLGFQLSVVPEPSTSIPLLSLLACLAYVRCRGRAVSSLR